MNFEGYFPPLDRFFAARVATGRAVSVVCEAPDGPSLLLISSVEEPELSLALTMSETSV
jgi:hypothetical protein